MSDLVKNLRNWSSLHGGQYSSELTTQAADLIEQQQARIDELAATVERLREQLSSMAAQHQCGCGHPACNRCRDDADNREVLRAAPRKNLNAAKREVAREAFIAGAKDAVAFISQQLRLGKTDIDLDAGLAAGKYIERIKDGEQ